MALTQNFHVISVLKRDKETVHGTNPELSCDCDQYKMMAVNSAQNFNLLVT